LNHIRSRSLKIGQKLVLTTPRFETPVEPVGNDAGEEADLSGAEYSEEDDLGPFDEDDVYWIQFEEDDEGNADLIGKWNSPEERRLFVKVVRGFLGAPYRPGGNSIRGLDCSAFVKKIYKFFDVDLPATAYEQAHVGLSIERESLEEGDLVFFNTGCAYGHVGIYIGNNEFIHASPRDRRVKVESLDSPYYDKRFIKAVRLKELETEV
ncbi:MAG: C40 family peptidase, partial [Deltaproteobacteria bacterium]|nr:C40 family peptidase [Deltaproteobacteria bacterium]